MERFFEELRKDLSNQVDQDIEAAENHLADILTPSFNNNDKVIKLTNYSYLRTN